MKPIASRVCASCRCPKRFVAGRWRCGECTRVRRLLWRHDSGYNSQRRADYIHKQNPPRDCEYCGCTFIPRRTDQRFHHRTCREMARYRRIIASGRPFTIPWAEMTTLQRNAILNRNRRWRERNRARIRFWNRFRSLTESARTRRLTSYADARERLAPYVVRQFLVKRTGFRVSEMRIPDSLMLAKRDQLTLFRLTRRTKKGNNERHKERRGTPTSTVQGD